MNKAYTCWYNTCRESHQSCIAYMMCISELGHGKKKVGAALFTPTNSLTIHTLWFGVNVIIKICADSML